MFGQHNDQSIELLVEAQQAERLGRFDEARAHLFSAMELADGDTLNTCRLRFATLCLAGRMELLGKAEELLHAVREDTTRTGNTSQMATAVHLLALVARRKGDREGAARLLDESPCLKQSDKAESGSEAGQWFHVRGLLYADAGNVTAAEQDFFLGLKLYEEAGNKQGLAELCDSLANLLYQKGKTASALRFAQRSLSIKHELKDRYGEALTLGTIGRIYMTQARYDDAKEAFTADLKIATELGDDRGIGIMLNSLGDACWSLREYDQAVDHFHENIKRAMGPKNDAFAWLGLARVYLSEGDLPQAKEAMEKLDQLLAQPGLGNHMVHLQTGLHGSLAWRSGDFSTGEKLLTAGIKQLRALHARLDALPLLYDLRDLYQHSGNMRKAVAKMTEALDLLSECGATLGVQDAEQWLRTADEPGLTRLALEQLVPQHLVQDILNGQLHRPKPHRQKITVLFSDIRDYTTLTEGLEPEAVIELLNEWFAEASRAIKRCGGIVDKFIGDAVMALFGVPDPGEQDAANALRTALEMRFVLESMNQRQEALNGKRLKIGIGIATGEAVIGFVGSHLRQSFTAIGDPVNIAARLESSTKLHDCEILICEETFQGVTFLDDSQVSSVGKLELKGKSILVGAYKINTGT